MLSVKRLATTYMMPCQNYLLQLWVRTKLDESPYPLIGHEIPLVIKVTVILRYCICFHHILFSSKWSQTIYIGFYHILLFFSCIGWDRRSTTRTKRLMTSTGRAVGDLYCLITQNPITYLFGRIGQFLNFFCAGVPSSCGGWARYRASQEERGLAARRRSWKRWKNISKGLGWKKSILTLTVLCRWRVVWSFRMFSVE